MVKRIGLVLSILLFFAANCFADELNMPVGVTPISQKIYHLHMVIFWICVAIGVVVFSVMIYSIIYHRKSKGHVAATFHEHTSLEVTWALIPLLILVAMAIPATKVLMAMYDTSQSDVTIKITGYQWKWKYEYLDQGVAFFSNLSTPYAQIKNREKKGEHYLLEVDHPMVVPIHKKLRLLVTSNDVAHSWWVPALGVKRDAIPGFIYEAWARIEKPGIYRGQCTELCGINHGFMPIVVKAVSESEYEQWLASQKATVQNQNIVPTSSPATPAEKLALKKDLPTMTFTQLMEKGKFIYEKTCVACHKEDGVGMPPAFPPLKGSSVVTGTPISRNIEVILRGRHSTAMQSFSYLNNEEIASVVTYVRNSWDNNTGDIIQPADVEQLRHKE